MCSMLSDMVFAVESLHGPIPFSRTSLQCAAYGGFVNCMSVLLEHKADCNAQDNEVCHQLAYSISQRPEAFRCLLNLAFVCRE